MRLAENNHSLYSASRIPFLRRAIHKTILSPRKPEYQEPMATLWQVLSISHVKAENDLICQEEKQAWSTVSEKNAHYLPDNR